MVFTLCALRFALRVLRFALGAVRFPLHALRFAFCAFRCSPVFPVALGPDVRRMTSDRQLETGDLALFPRDCFSSLPCFLLKLGPNGADMSTITSGGQLETLRLSRAIVFSACACLPQFADARKTRPRENGLEIRSSKLLSAPSPKPAFMLLHPTQGAFERN